MRTLPGSEQEARTRLPGRVIDAADKKITSRSPPPFAVADLDERLDRPEEKFGPLNRAAATALRHNVAPSIVIREASSVLLPRRKNQ
jgi:hypothetical protein